MYWRLRARGKKKSTGQYRRLMDRFLNSALSFRSSSAPDRITCADTDRSVLRLTDTSDYSVEDTYYTEENDVKDVYVFINLLWPKTQTRDQKICINRLLILLLMSATVSFAIINYHEGKLAKSCSFRDSVRMYRISDQENNR